MSIRDDYKPFTDDYGIVHCDLASKGYSQNGPRWSTEFYFALKRHQELNLHDKTHFNYILQLCQVQPGLLRRHPTSDEQEGPDDTYAALALSKELGGEFARAFLATGRDTKIIGYDETYDRKKWYSKPAMWFCKLTGYKYVYNNNRPGWFNDSAWMGRQLPLIAHAKVCAGESLHIGWRLAWCIGVLVSAFSKNSQDGKVLNWFMIKGSENSRSWLMNKVAKFWTKKLKAQWEGGIGGVLKAYFQNKEQPSIKWLWDEYGD